MKYKKLILGLLTAIFIIGLITYYSVFTAPHKLNIREETLYSTKIDSSLDNLTIAFFSDLHYGTFIGKNDVTKCVETINCVDPDIVIFGGDLIDNYINKGVKEETKELLINELSLINANIAKYAVLGEQDGISDESRDEIMNILEAAGFTMLINDNVQIYNGENSCFNLIGIDNLINGNPDIYTSYEGLNDNAYTIIVSHCPDTFDDINTNMTDYFLAGHSHGGQIYIPIFNRLYRQAGCIDYFTGKHKNNNAILDITNGVGLTNKSIRLFADAEVVFYKLKAK